ncbi:hypothetical protein BD289DRAFT_375090 [Coniella lustricola]|uniref:RNAse P Rpr2/Rpp21/SNM1 subunit domain-domain-containing protein n=1 Tax=Coniella lustricola TaxID=2025994 RepID=A0A2T2ZYS3_9PEZI|nr:hypothetical protein BD289DRAFT_375090 [Coniella lustricola]
MLFQDLSPHVNYLNDAAHLLSQASPETSAFLMRRRNELLVENDVPISDAQRQHVCSSCGHILMPGQGDMLTINPNKASRNKSRIGKKNQRQRPPATPTLSAQAHARSRLAVSKVISCGQCHRATRLEMEGPKPILRQLNSAATTTAAAAAISTTDEPVKTSANANSKKRAKNRKAGLQALLDQKQTATSSSGLGFSLTDFLKK